MSKMPEPATNNTKVSEDSMSKQTGAGARDVLAAAANILNEYEQGNAEGCSALILPEPTADPDMTIYGYYSKRKMNDSDVSLSDVSLSTTHANKKIKCDQLNDELWSEGQACLQTSMDRKIDNDKTYIFGLPSDLITPIKDCSKSSCQSQSGKGNDSKSGSDCKSGNDSGHALVHHCTNCIDNYVASFQCKDCVEEPYLCVACAEAHRRVRLTRQHKLVDLVIEIQSPKEECDRIRSWIDPYFVDGFSFSDSVELGPGTFDESVELTDRLYNSCLYLRSSNRKKYLIEKELHEATSGLRDFIIQLMTGGPCESVITKACYIISQLVDRKIIQAGFFLKDPIIETMKQLCSINKNRPAQVVTAVLLALRSIATEVNELKSIFDLYKLRFLEDEVKTVYKEFKMQEVEFTTKVFGFATPLLCDIAADGPGPVHQIAGDIINILENYYLL